MQLASGASVGECDSTATPVGLFSLKRTSENMRESVRPDSARRSFINPRKPCYQEAVTAASGSAQKGLSSILLC